MSQQRWANHIQPFTWGGVSLPSTSPTPCEPFDSPTLPRFRFLKEPSAQLPRSSSDAASNAETLSVPKPRPGVVTIRDLFTGACRGIERTPRKTTYITRRTVEHQTLESAVMNRLRGIADSFGYDPTAIRFKTLRRAIVNPHGARSNDSEDEFLHGQIDDDDVLYSQLDIFADKTLAPVIITEHCIEVLTKSSLGLFAYGDRTDDSYDYFYALPQSALRESIANLSALLQSNSLQQLQEVPCPNYVFSLLVAHLANRQMNYNHDTDEVPEYPVSEEDTEASPVEPYHYQEAANSLVVVKQVGSTSITPHYRISYGFHDGLYTYTLGVYRNLQTGALSVKQIPAQRGRRH